MAHPLARWTAVLTLLLSTCGGGSQPGGGSAGGGPGPALSIPAVRPPVQAALPSALLRGGSSFAGASEPAGPIGVRHYGLDYARECQTDMAVDHCVELQGASRLSCVVKQRLFCAGPTELLRLLDDLDGRAHQVASMARPGAACLMTAAVDHAADLDLPGGQPFHHFLQCKESAIELAFGDQAGAWYLRSGGGAGGNVFSVSPTSDVSGYLWVDGQLAGSTVLLRLATSKAQGTVELTGGGVGVGFCALHFRSDAAHLWLRINPDGADGSCDYDGSGTTDAADYSELCLGASGLDVVDASACASLKAGRTLTLLGRDHALAPPGGAVRAFAAAAPPPNGDPILLIDVAGLHALSQHAGRFDGVEELTSSGGDGGPGPDSDGGPGELPDGHPPRPGDHQDLGLHPGDNPDGGVRPGDRPDAGRRPDAG